jgi:hypothetical protein
MELTRFRGHLNVRDGGAYGEAVSPVYTGVQAFKRQMVDLVRSGRNAASLAKDFGPSAWTIALWVNRGARDGGAGDGGLTSAEREELEHNAERLAAADLFRIAGSPSAIRSV